MTSIDSRDTPVDPTSAERLAAQSLSYRVLDLDDAVRVEGFQRTMSRGFLGPEPSAEALTFGRSAMEARRNIGVYDAPESAEARPVATIDSWVTPLAVGRGTHIPMWAISGVTVAATHRRRGIARALLEGELRAAAGAGVPIAGLTVSEATIYGRYGFGSALPMSHVAVDTRRAGWAGPSTEGTFEYVDREMLAAELGEVHERARLGRLGLIPGWDARWKGMAGLSPSDTERDQVRGVRFRDGSGAVRGVLAFTLSERNGSFRFALNVRLLVAETAEATAALWGFALQHDLVDEVTADLRPVDDPLPWLVRDPRGVTQTVHDHGWLRILDVRAVLESRTYSAPLDLVIRVNDRLGIAEGVWRLRVDGSGRAAVENVADAASDVDLDVATLSVLFAGAVSASTLSAAGRIAAGVTAIESLDRAFASFPAPALDIWY
ncbi:GNAT family N-acetyltransferase [Microbacterium sp. 3J1]|uniref:GNAT family N-acetyltransferase n=1 Tax=Microbacterium sp. 3J1 TaxID=861269 RepID=UPI000AF0F678|nr:GNAT family N-acetyltransferase [Microbacterium sp. 3J1]